MNVRRKCLFTYEHVSQGSDPALEISWSFLVLLRSSSVNLARMSPIE